MRGAARRALLYARTAAGLRPVQWWYQGVRRVQGLPRVGRPDAQLADAPAAADAVASWGEGDAHALRVAREVLDGRFVHLNHAETLERVDWGRRYASRLWTYHLHYFDYAPELARAFRATTDERFARRFEALAESWMAAPPGAPGWEPYPLSVRAVNWTAALLLFGDALRPEARRRIAGSLARQLAVLERRLELHVQANHLLKNYFALSVGGLAFAGRDAARWRRTGLQGLWRQLDEQVLDDGGHVERSPMYQAIVLADGLQAFSLCAAAGEPVPEPARDRVRALARALGVLCRPDGRLHLFNDAAQGQAPSRAALDALARRVLGEGIPAPEGLLSLPASGYWGAADPAGGDRFLIDCGAGGPRWQPGHMHCDLLSFELDLGGVAFAVDSGLRGYEADPLREYVRGTRAHNTVAVAGREQAEVWGTFRVARHPRVHGAEQAGTPDAYRFRGAYSPYHDPRCRHERTVRREGRTWTVTDRVRGAAGASLASYLHLHPEWRVEAEGGRFAARRAGRAVVVEPFGVDEVEVVRGREHPPQGWYCPEFGAAVPAPVLEMRVRANAGGEFGYAVRPA